MIIYLLTAVSHSAEWLSKLGIGSFRRWESGQKIRILLVGYNGARNTGSDVRVAAIARQVKEVFGAENVQITVMTFDASTLEGYFDEDVSLYSFTTLFPLSLLRACTSHHAAILCEGSTLKSTFANGLTLFLCEAAGVMDAGNKPCIAYGSEVGQMEPFIRRAAARLCRNTYFITRTRGSLEALRSLGLKGHAGTDAAWSYDGAISPEEAERILRKQGWDGVRPLIGIAVIDPFCWPVRASLFRWIRGHISGDLSGQYDKWYFYSDSPERREAFMRYLDGVAEGVSAFTEKNDCFPIIIGMERLDAKACEILKDKLDRPGAVFLSGDNDAGVMTGILRKLSYLVTSRYHAAVLSMEGGCPVIAVSMDERLDGIMKELSLDHGYLFHTDDTELGSKIAGALDEAKQNREIIRKRTGEHLVLYKKELEDMGLFMKKYISAGLAHELKRGRVKKTKETHR